MSVPQIAPESIANAVDSLVRSLTAAKKSEIYAAETELRRINALLKVSEEGEREKYLAPFLSAVEAEQSRRDDLIAESRFSVLLAPRARWAARRQVESAKIELARARERFSSQELSDARARRIRLHNANVDSECAKTSSLLKRLAEVRAELASVGLFESEAVTALVAARTNGWKHSSFLPMLVDVRVLLEQDRASDARDRLRLLRFQDRPTAAVYERWLQEASTIRQTAYGSFGGMAASGAYPIVSSDSVPLMQSALRTEDARLVAACNQAADQWQMASGLLADPNRFRNEVLWAIYWSMFQCSQWVAANLKDSDAIEDVVTGKLAASMAHFLAAWGRPRVEQLGYPQASAFLGTLEIAGTREETRLGADIGFVVDIDVGDLVCRKVAIFQAKKTRNWIADIGSQSEQLSKLSARPCGGYYAFYHQAAYPLQPAAPTVAKAADLAATVMSSNRDIAAEHLNVRVDAQAWDLASFVSFAICNPDSQHGEPFSSPDDMLSVLGNGDPRNLPRYLTLIALSDAPRVESVRAKIAQRYVAHEQSNERKRGIDRSQTGFEQDRSP